MSAPSIHEFWQLAEASGLVDSQQVAVLKNDFEHIRGATSVNTRTLCEWLIDRRALSRFQCDVLLLGQSGPFYYGDYLVWDRLTQGRLQGLFRAVHLPTRQPAMLQFLSGPGVFDPQRVAAAKATAAAWAQLDDPHLVACFELLEIGAYKFIVLEDLHGRSAAQWVRAVGRVSVGQACALARDAALALAALHARVQVHGDVRPENLWCRPTGHSQLLGFPLVRDPLGPAFVLDDRSVDYTAPELSDYGSTPTPLTDMYSLGCTFYELLTGRPPFDGVAQSSAQKMQRHATEPIVPLEQFGPMPEGLNRLVSFLMAKNPAVRSAQAAVVAEALLPYAAAAFTGDDRGLSDAPPGAGTNAFVLRTFCRQRPASAPPPSGASAESAPVITAATSVPPVSSSPLAARAMTVSTAPGPRPAGPDMGRPADVAQPIFQPSSQPAVPGGPSFEELFRFDSGTSAPAVVIQPQGHDASSQQSRRGQSSTKRNLLVVGAVLAAIALLVAGLAAVEYYHPSQGPVPPLAQKPDAEKPPVVAPTDTDNPSTAAVRLLALKDDGHSLWASPTTGGAPQIKYVAPGAQILVVLQPQSLLGSPRGRQTLEAMGPAGTSLRAWIETETGVKLEEIDRLDIAFYEAFGSRPLTSLVAYAKNRPPVKDLVASWGNPTPTVQGGVTFYEKDDRCHYLPPGDKQAIVAAPRSRLDDILVKGDAPATLDPNLAELVNTADVQRHVNVFFLPIYLRGARETLYPGALSPVRDALDWFLGATEDLQAGAISFELSDPLFAELRLYPARSTKPVVMARQFHDRINLWSPKVQNHLVSLTISPYSREVLGQFPFMLEALARYTRHGAEDRMAVVRWYLPGSAAPNLAAATDLLLLETAGTVQAPALPQALAPKTVWDRLKLPVTVTFERDSLENALKLLSTEMGVKIEILGNDLKLDGITKNQPLGVNLRNQPAEEVLNQIMLQANPDRTVRKLSDDVQKLVYVVKPQYEGGEDAILVTTRAKAAEHGELPSVFKK